MASDASTTCPSCGAHVPATASRCDLCGTAIEDAGAERAPDEAPAPERASPSTDEAPSASEPAAPDEAEAATDGEGAASAPNGREAKEQEPSSPERDAAEGDPAGGSEGGIYCNQCGWENPNGARFCSRCGEQLQDMSTAGQTDAPPDGTRPVAADLPSASRTENKASSDVPSSEAASSDATAPAAAEPGGEGEAEGDAAPDSVDAPDADEQAAQQMQLQVGLLVGIALAAIVGFFFVTTWSQSVSWGGSDSGAGSPSAQGPAASAPAQGGGGPSIGGGSAGSNAPPLETLVEENASGSDGQAAAGVTAQADSLQRVVDQNDGVRRRQARQELVNLYIGAGQLGEAALTQRRMAETSGDPADWRRTGDLLYSWMETIEDRGTKAQVAPRVVEAYERVLAENPDNLDVRTDMATALLQTNNPMRGVEEINRVLKQDSTHFQARFNKGIMLTMIGRVDQAIEQFELVKRIVGEESPYFEQANQAIQTIQQQEQGGGSAGQQGVPTSPAPDPAGNTTSDTPAPER